MPIDELPSVNSESSIDTKFVQHYDRVMKNVTITLDEEVARWARVWAAEHDTSVSQFLAGLLKDRMLQEHSYQAAMKQYLSQKPAKLKKRGSAYPRRTELYDR